MTAGLYATFACYFEEKIAVNVDGTVNSNTTLSDIS